MTRKPTQRRGKATVEAIIQAGFITVAEHGLDGATTRQIAAVAGISAGSLYEYFENKEAIFRAMNQYFTREVILVLRDIEPSLPVLPLDEAIRQLLTGFSDLLTRDDSRYLKCLRFAGQFDYASYAHQVEGVLTEVIMRYVMQNPAYLRAPNFYTLCYVSINGAIFTIVRHLILPDSAISFEQMLDGVLRMVTSYVNAEMARLEPAN